MSGTEKVNKAGPVMSCVTETYMTETVKNRKG